MNSILIIEDDTDINNLIAGALKKSGYGCTQAFSGTEALLYAERDSFDLAIMDLMLPGLCGETLLPKFKKKQDIPVIVLSAKDSLDSKVALLSAGADDYMTKPFEIDELMVRISVQLRRQGSGNTLSKQLVCGGLTLNLTDFSASANERPLSLTRQEFKILELLLSHPNRVFSKQDIYDYAWDDIYIGEDKTINVHISNIRKKLKTACGRDYIETVWGIGFKLAKQP